MSKERNRGNREIKKPKADKKKPIAVAAAFLRVPAQALPPARK